MKRKFALIVVLVLILSVAAYSTFAYFTAEGKTANVITAGNINMKLHQETANGQTSPDTLNDVMPGETTERVVYVENTSDHALYARIKLSPEILSPSGAALSFDKVSLDIDTVNWQLGSDGWYYYLSSLDKGEKAKPLFTEIKFAEGMGNDYMSAKISINVSAQAVQCANNGDTVWQAAGWPAES